jgi:L-lactate dehydrogenase complex protein LldG
MKVSLSKEKILKKIREALSEPVPLPFPKSEGSLSIFPEPKEDLEILFAEEFTRLLGKFAFCVNEEEMMMQLRDLITEKKWNQVYCPEATLKNILNKNEVVISDKVTLHECDVAVTSCRALIARTGSIVMTADQPGGRTTSVYAPIHICIAYVDQLVYDTRDALKLLKEAYNNSLPSLITFAAGPSRTADIEKTLVVGVHGPKEVYLFLIDQPSKK